MTANLRPSGISWNDFAKGDEIKQALEQQLTQWWPQLFGYHLLQLGTLGAQLDVKASVISKSYCLHQYSTADIVGDVHQLPIKSATVDALIMSLLLEFEENPYQVLREADRVLIIGGYLFIAGINPISTASIGKIIPKYRQKLPWHGHFFTPARIKDWLGLLGYQILQDNRFLYHSLLPCTLMPAVFQKLQQKLLPSTGSCYFIVARKLEAPLTPIAPKMRQRPILWQPVGTCTNKSNRQLSSHKKKL